MYLQLFSPLKPQLLFDGLFFETSRLPLVPLLLLWSGEQGEALAPEQSHPFVR